VQLQPRELGAFALPPNVISKAMAYHTVAETWYFVPSHGQMRRRFHDRKVAVDMEPDVSITNPVATDFQSRSGAQEPLMAVKTTVPPWPSKSEAFAVAVPWETII